MTYGEVLRALLDDRGMKQCELAEKANLTTGSISRYINDENLPNLYAAIQIAKAFDVSIDAMVSGDMKNLERR